MKTAGVEVDSYLAEFAAGQFEVTVPPQDALAACDTAVIVRELARATAFRRGHSVSFSPRVTPDGLGSGVHIHFSLWDQSGKPVSHDPARPFGIGKTAGQFLSGVVRHMPALCGFTAPSPVSCLRLVSHSWTGVWSNLGLRDREAGLRICPAFGTSPEAVARQFNFEYRAADATANPYLQLAVILRAGLAGIRDGLAAPQPTSREDPETMTPEARAARHILRLPASTDAAFAALEADPVGLGFLPERLLHAYIANKQAEFALSRDWTPAEICQHYAEVYCKAHLMGKLDDRVAIVTGAATGLGRAIALLYAAEGADVAVLDRNGTGAETVAEAIRALGRRSLAVQVDVGDEDSVQTAIAPTIAKLGPPDILVTNAGIATVSLLDDMPTALWDEMLRVNLSSVFYCIRAVLPHMQMRRNGRIINISSQLAHKGGEGMAHYAAAKAGILGLTRSLAYEVTRDNIAVNAICPGPLRTDKRLPPEWAAKKQSEPVIGRQGRVEEIAPTALLLATEDAEFYVGATFNPNGGITWYDRSTRTCRQC